MKNFLILLSLLTVAPVQALASKGNPVSEPQIMRAVYDNEKNALDVGTSATVVEVTPTLDTNAYASGDRLGSIMTLTDAARLLGGTATLLDVSVVDQAKQCVAVDILFFDESPTVASADNAAIDIADAQMIDKFLGRVSIATTDWTNLAGNCEASPAQSAKIMKAISTSKNLYALAVVRSGTPTFAAGSLVFRFKFVQD